MVLQRDIVGPPEGRWVSLWSSNGTLLVLQWDIGVVLSPLGVKRGPPKGHCRSSKGTLDVTVVLQGDIVGPPKGRWVSPWSSKGTLLVLQRDIGVVLSLLGVTVVLQRDTVGPPKGHRCHCGPPRGHCQSSKGTLLVLQRDNVGCQCGPPKPPPPFGPPIKM